MNGRFLRIFATVFCLSSVIASTFIFTAILRGERISETPLIKSAFTQQADAAEETFQLSPQSTLLNNPSLNNIYDASVLPAPPPSQPLNNFLVNTFGLKDTNKVTVRPGSYFDEDAQFLKDLNVSDNAFVEKDLEVKGDLRVEGEAVFKEGVSIEDELKVNGIKYAFPENQIAGILLNDGNGTLTWSAVSPTHDAVTLSGSLDYLTLSGQQIIMNQIDISTDVAGATLSTTELNYLDGSTITNGGVIFGNGTNFTQDAASLFWNDSTNRLGVGTTAPSEKLEVNGRIALTGSTNMDPATIASYPALFLGITNPILEIGYNVQTGSAKTSGVPAVWMGMEANYANVGYQAGQRTYSEWYINSTDSNGKGIRPIAFTWDNGAVDNFLKGSLYVSPTGGFDILKTSDSSSLFHFGGDGIMQVGAAIQFPTANPYFQTLVNTPIASIANGHYTWASNNIDGYELGLNRDTNIYRSAVNTLKTDDTLVVAGALNVDGASNSYIQGNVGIGTTAPTSKFAIVGLGTGTGTNLVVDASGNVLRDSSSERYKEDIETLDVDFSKVLELEPKSYKFKDSGLESIGYIAEQAEELGLNDLLIFDSEGRVDGFQYDRLPIYNLELIKDIHSKVENLENEILSLKGVEINLGDNSLGDKFSLAEDGSLIVKADLKVEGEVEVSKLKIDEEQGSIGQVTISAGKDSITVATDALTEDSVIGVTPDTPVTISARKTAENEFEIRLDKSYESEIEVDWWIMN